MNRLEEIQGNIKRFINEKEQIQTQITEIEEKRTQLAQQRNEKKKLNGRDDEVNKLGEQISDLGNQSQKLQNQIDFNFHETKIKLMLMIDNLVWENVRKIRIINQQIQELEEKISNKRERDARYQLQRQEFFAKFGRMPELSERAQKENELQEKEITKCELEIVQMREQIGQIETEIDIFAKIKNEIKIGNWSFVLQIPTLIEQVCNEELEVEEIYVDDFAEIEELYIEEFEPIEELVIDEFDEEKWLETTNEVAHVEEINSTDEIEKMARSIVEEIAAQTKEYNAEQITEQDIEKDIIEFEREENTAKTKVIIPLFGKTATISTIVVKIEDGELVYKAKMSDEEVIKIYPSKLGKESVLLRDKQNRKECNEILVNYAECEYKIFDKKVISQIDPLICELLIECADRYNYNAKELIYNYAMSFSWRETSETDSVPDITYNLSYLKDSSLSKKEKAIIKKICRSARLNNKVDIIESFAGFKKIKYVFKKLFAVNNVKLLTDANIK